MRQSEETALV